jgi:hypothetical protein
VLSAVLKLREENQTLVRVGGGKLDFFQCAINKLAQTKLLAHDIWANSAQELSIHVTIHVGILDDVAIHL